MPLKDRIIGGGFLVVGVSIVLVLIYLFTVGKLQPEEAYKQIRGELFPAYQEAEREADYGRMTAVAKQIVDSMADAGAVPVKEYIRAEAFAGTDDAKRLHSLVQSATFGKNAEGLFEFKGEWYPSLVHRSLTELGQAIEQKLKVVRSVREIATDARAALGDARTGSGMALELPAARPLPPEDIPILDPNPVYANDEELFRVFGLPAEELVKALATQNPGGRATSARLRWNQNIATGDLGRRIGGLPELAEGLPLLGAQIHSSAKQLDRKVEASKALDRLMLEASGYIGAGLDTPHREGFQANRSLFTKGLAVKQVLERERLLLEPYLVNVRALGNAFESKFAE